MFICVFRFSGSRKYVVSKNSISPPNCYGEVTVAFQISYKNLHFFFTLYELKLLPIINIWKNIVDAYNEQTI